MTTQTEWTLHQTCTCTHKNKVCTAIQRQSWCASGCHGTHPPWPTLILSFMLWIYSILNLSSQFHWFWDQCIPESRLIQTPQVCVRFSFNFRHWLILFVSPANCHQPESRAVGHPCNPCNPWGVVFTACIVFSPSQHWNRTKNTRLTLPNQSTMIRHNAA